MEVELYYANWCGHCKTFKPEWEVLKTKLNELGIRHNEFEESLNKQDVEKANISAFPTIRVKANGEQIEYNGRRSAADILNFLGVLPSNLNKKQTGGAASVDPFKQKYYKYKGKYLSLKKNMN
jgi:thiol-disulfide isomerase/thioredoxin